MLTSSFIGESLLSRLKIAEYRPDVDERELALYTPAEAGRYLGIPTSTLNRWIYGNANFSPIIEPADPGNRLLSFFNLAEAHVLAATRYKHRVKFEAIRSAIKTVRDEYPDPHPLISKDFLTDGKDIFVEKVGEIANLSRPDVRHFDELMTFFLRKIVRDKDKLVKQLYPVIRKQPDDDAITIIHGIASGQPLLAGYGVPVFVIYGRHTAGETNKSIAKDFGMPEAKVKRAIDYVERTEIEQRKVA
jgi:uncharacterized protein (DUF433 family)